MSLPVAGIHGTQSNLLLHSLVTKTGAPYYARHVVLIQGTSNQHEVTGKYDTNSKNSHISNTYKYLKN